MRTIDLYDAFIYISDDFIEESAPLAKPSESGSSGGATSSGKGGGGKFPRRAAAIAACLALVLLAVFAVPNLFRDEGTPVSSGDASEVTSVGESTVSGDSSEAVSGTESTVSSGEAVESKKVIYATAFDEASPKNQAIGVGWVARRLTELIEQHKGEDVAYRVFVNFLIWGNDFEEDTEKADAALDGLLSFAKDVGATDIVAADDCSDYQKYWRGGNYFMTLTAEAIEKMSAHASAENGAYEIYPAAQERVGGYDMRISDYLTVLLDEAQSDDSFLIVAETVIDRGSNYLWMGGSADADVLTKGSPLYTYHTAQYNEALNEPFYYDGDNISAVTYSVRGRYGFEVASADELDEKYGLEKLDAAIKEYVKELLEERGLAYERLIDGNFESRISDSDITGFKLRSKLPGIYIHGDSVIIAAGFQAVLTKAEILELAKSDKIKSIYALDDDFGFEAGRNQ